MFVLLVSFGFLPIDTPPLEGNVPYYTPSPSLTTDLGVAKAPVKKVRLSLVSFRHTFSLLAI